MLDTELRDADETDEDDLLSDKDATATSAGGLEVAELAYETSLTRDESMMLIDGDEPMVLKKTVLKAGEAAMPEAKESQAGCCVVS